MEHLVILSFKVLPQNEKGSSIGGEVLLPPEVAFKLSKHILEWKDNYPMTPNEYERYKTLVKQHQKDEQNSKE